LRGGLHLGNLYRHKSFFLVALLYLLSRGLGILYSVNFADGLFEFSKDFLQIVLVFYLLLSFRDFQDFKKKYLYPILVFALIISIYGIIQILLELRKGDYNVDASYNVKTFFAHRNLYAHILVFTVPMLLSEGLNKLRFQWLKIPLLSVIIFLIFFLFSRTAWLSIIGASILVGIVIIIKMLKSNRLNELLPNFIRHRSIILIPAIILILFTVSLAFIEKNELSRQFHNLNKWDYGSSQKRIEAWKGSFELIKEKPLLGQGTASWKIEILKYISDNEISKDNMTFYQRPHNDFLWIWTESGSVGILLYVFLFFYLFRHLWKSLKRNEGNFNAALIPLFGLSAYVIIALFSFPRERIEHGIFLSFFIVQALLINSTKEKTSKINWIISFLLIFSLVCLSLFYYVDTFRLRGEILLRQAFRYRDKQMNSEVIRIIQQAESKYFNMDYTSMPISWYCGSAYYNLGIYDLALGEFNRSMKLNPYNVNILVNAGSAHYKLGNLDEAKEMYLSAYKLNSKNIDVLINLSVAEFQNGDLNSSMRYIESMDLKDLNIGQKKIIIKILDHKVKELMANERDPAKAEILRRMTLSKKWLYNLLIKASENDLKFETMVNMDVEYIVNKY